MKIIQAAADGDRHALNFICGHDRREEQIILAAEQAAAQLAAAADEDELMIEFTLKLEEDDDRDHWRVLQRVK